MQIFFYNKYWIRNQTKNTLLIFLATPPPPIHWIKHWQNMTVYVTIWYSGNFNLDALRSFCLFFVYFCSYATFRNTYNLSQSKVCHNQNLTFLLHVYQSCSNCFRLLNFRLRTLCLFYFVKISLHNDVIHVYLKQ